MMQANHEPHLRSVRKQYERRADIAGSPFPDALHSASLERWLRARLAALAAHGYVDESPVEGPDVFATLASECYRGEASVWSRAVAGPLMGEAACVQGAADALALLPVPIEVDAFVSLYNGQPNVRPALLDICRRARLPVPGGLLNAAELQRQATPVRIAALRYKAAQPDCGSEVFRAYYAPLLGGVGAQARFDEPAVATALWGGLLRGDHDAVRALGLACEQSETQEGRRVFLRLMALVGEPAFEPVLREVARVEPAYGMYLLGLYGRGGVVPLLLKGLDRAPAMGAAAEAWVWITGVGLPTKPRLGLVAKGSNAPAQAPAAGRRPHEGEAQRRWNASRDDWPLDERRVAGRRFDLAGIAHAAGCWGGRAGRDALDLLALETGGRTQPDPDGWMEHRLQAIAALGIDPEADIPDDLDGVDGWERGHHA